MEVKDRIISETEALFFKYGVKSVTMDEVARHLSISKKTIYQFFKDKDDLVCTVTKHHLDEQQQLMQSLSKNSLDPVDEVLKISEYMKVSIQKMNPSILFDIQKFHPRAWKIYQDYKVCCIHDTLLENLRKGIEKGYYRNELDIEIIARFRVEQIQLAFNPFVFPPDKFDLTKVQLQFIDHFLHGICTLKGHKLINKYKQITEED